MYTNEEQLRAAYALNLCTVSVSQIIAYNDIGVLEQEYENILNNLNLERIPKDDALREVYNQILDTIKLCRISEGDKKQIDLVYQHKVKNAVWSAVPRLGMIFATHDLAAMALTLASQVGIGYMNYRRNKADYQMGREQEYWQLERNKLEMFGQLEGELFNTAWNLAEAYDYPDEYRLTSEQLTEYNKALMEDNPISRYGKLDGMSAQFAAYPHFWYQMGSTANSIYHDSNMPDEIKNKYKNAAIHCFEQYRKLNKYNLLRHDAISAAWALEYVELLDLDHSEEDRKKAVELLQEAENHAGNKNKDVLELCACAYLKLGNLNEAARLLRKLVNWGYNAEVNVQILSAIYLHIINPNNPTSTDNNRLKASEEYSELRFVTQPQYILPKPSTEEEWAKWTPMWEKHDASDIGEAEKPTFQSLDSSQVEKSIANVMGWVANRGGFDAVTAYETKNYYLIAFEDSGLYSSGVPLRNNLQPSLIRIDKKTGRIFSNRIDSASRNYGKDNSFYWGKRINCIRGDVVFRNDHGCLQYLDVGNLKDWQNLADFRNGRYRYGRIIQGNEVHLVFPLNGKICDYNTVYNRCEEVCDFPAAFYSHMDFYSTPFYLTNDEIFILDKDSVYFYDLVKKQSTLLFEVSDVNCICYVCKHSDPKSGKYLIFYFIREGFSSDHSLIKK